MNYGWDEAKDLEIQEKHGISFSEILNLIESGYLIGVLVNRSPKYPGQKAMLVWKGKAVYMVPFEKKAGKIKLITAFFSPHFTKKYSR